MDPQLPLGRVVVDQGHRQERGGLVGEHLAYQLGARVAGAEDDDTLGIRADLPAFAAVRPEHESCGERRRQRDRRCDERGAPGDQQRLRGERPDREGAADEHRRTGDCLCLLEAAGDVTTAVGAQQPARDGLGEQGSDGESGRAPELDPVEREVVPRPDGEDDRGVPQRAIDRKPSHHWCRAGMPDGFHLLSLPVSAPTLTVS